MKKRVKKELEEFLKYKENYQFEQKELVIDGENIYCDGELVQQGDEVIGETDKLINVSFKSKGSWPKMLSNLFPYEFEFRGKKLSSIECFFQGIKFKDKNVQNYVFKYSGIQAVHIKTASDYEWKEDGVIYWQGKPIKRLSAEYDAIIDELYISAIQNPLYRGILLKCNKPIIHTIGNINKEDTTFTRYEFEFELNCLKDFLKHKNG